MVAYTDLLGPKRAPPGVRHAGTDTPAHQVLKGREGEMHINAAGGAVFTLDDWGVVRRFLVLGTTQNTYYATSEQVSHQALTILDRALQADPKRFVDLVVDVSVSGAPLKQSPCIFALARACSYKTGDHSRDTNNSDPVTIGRAYALSQAPRVLRTYQHVFEFLDYVRRQRGAGRGLLSMLQSILLTPPLPDVEYQALKYRNRVGWSPRDLLRYSHPKTTAERSDFFGWLVKPESEAGRRAVNNSARLAAFETIQSTRDEKLAAQLIADHRLTHEFVPNELLGSREVWAALLPNLPLTALTRNLRKMTQVGLLVSGSDALKTVRERLVNAEGLKRARLHPLRLMGASGAYGSGAGRHGGDFIPSGEVISILEDALDLSWGVIEPLNRSVVVGIDCSGSMSQASPMAGLSAFHACLALAAWYKRSEARCEILLFDSTARLLKVSNKVTWSELKKTSNPAGSTNLAAPMTWLLSNPSVNPELIVTMTDNETWSGKGHYVEHLGRLRQKLGHPIATSVAAVTVTNSTVADPNDPHSLEIVGFDATVPEALAAHTKEVFR